MHMGYATVVVPGLNLNIPHNQSLLPLESRHNETYTYDINLVKLQEFSQSIEKISSEYQYIVLKFVKSSYRVSESVYDIQLLFYNDQYEAQVAKESIQSLFSTTPHDNVLSGLLKSYIHITNQYLNNLTNHQEAVNLEYTSNFTLNYLKEFFNEIFENFPLENHSEQAINTHNLTSRYLLSDCSQAVTHDLPPLYSEEDQREQQSIPVVQGVQQSIPLIPYQVNLPLGHQNTQLALLPPYTSSNSPATQGLVEYVAPPGYLDNPNTYQNIDTSLLSGFVNSLLSGFVNFVKYIAIFLLLDLLFITTIATFGLILILIFLIINKSDRIEQFASNLFTS